MARLPATVTEVASELPSLSICNRHARARVFLHGAHVASFRPVGEAEVLWMSIRSQFAPGKPIRGGVPICFPWFGMHPEGGDRPPHGVVRLSPWTITSADDLPDGQTRLVLGLDSPPFTLAYTVTVGAELELALEVRNTGNAPASFEEALHTYFDVADVRRASIEGLAGAAFIDKTDGSATKTQSGALTFTAETDRLFQGTTSACTIVDPVLGRRIVVAKKGSRSTVVWNPWVAKAARMPDFGDDEWPSMLCIEAANAADHRVTLAPGASHLLSQTVSVQRLAR